MKALAVSVFAAAMGGAVLCPICEPALAVAQNANVVVAAQGADTATAKLHISGMTCGTCPVTARAALRKLPGVYSATVTLDDSLGVVRYDARKVTPADIAAHLTKLTGYGAKVIPDTAKAPRRSGR